MMHLIKRFRTSLIFIVIEAFFFMRADKQDLEFFFMIWGFIAIGLILNKIFTRNDHIPMMGPGASQSVSYGYQASAMLEKQFENGQKKPKHNQGVIFDFVNLQFLVLLVMNVVGYIIIMPK